MYIPPSTNMCTPVTKADSSEAKNSTALAVSSGTPALPIGWESGALWAMLSLISRARPSGMCWSGVKMLVRIRPGQMAFTRMPSRPSSAADSRDRWITAAFITE